MRVLNLTTNPNARFYVQQLQALDARGVESTTLSVPGRYYDSQADEKTRSPLSYFRFVPTVLRHAQGDYDLLHANYGLTAPAALAQLRRPVVLSFWGSDLFGEFGWLGKRCADHCDAVIVMSDEMADELDCDCHVIPHGINLDRFRPIPTEEARASVGWEQEGYHVLFPYAPSRPVKNYPLAERVVEAAQAELDVPIRLQTLSGVDHERMPYYYNASDALLVTSHHEGSPNSVKEAMGCNLPIVATDVGDVRERLADVRASAVCGSEAELTAALVDVLKRGERSNGRDAAREVSLDQMATDIIAVYESVLGIKPRRDAQLSTDHSVDSASLN